MPGIKTPKRAGPFLGFSSTKDQFKFNGNWGSTVIRVTQAGLEPWYNTNAPVRVTQAGLEPWFNVDGDLVVTQAGLEIWISATQLATITLEKTAHLGPRGFLGIVPRTFRERTLPTFGYPDPPVLVTIVVPRDRIGPRGFLGVVPRTFREHSLPYIPPYVPPPPFTGGSAFLWVVT